MTETDSKKGSFGSPFLAFLVKISYFYSMIFTDEEVIAELIGSEDLSINEQLKNLRLWLRNTMNTMKPKPDGTWEVDPQTVYYNAAYCMAEAGTKIGMIAMRNRMRLNEMKKQYAIHRKEALDKLHHDRSRGWSPNDKEKEVLVNGDVNLAEEKMMIDNQEDFIQFLAEQQEQIRYYARNADVLVKVHNFGQEIGKIIV